eukprot:TRINITY_DN9395_c0_g1_i1.p1 TRINITY_DN9395_c0_g1~~TRINITY_DN9395_c0_g1_i1.p1  ORF type:complete len:1026 (+),score=183.90 TRINITY_DN9395_c0_g1_i1:123-3080(+)
MSKSTEMKPIGKPRTKKDNDLPVEIDKSSIVRYLKKDVSKTQLYKSLPFYLLILVILSISISLRRNGDPLGYWVNTKVTDSLVGDQLPSGKNEFFEISSVSAFYDWYEKQILTIADANLGGYIPLTGSMLLRQFRGKAKGCSEDGEHNLFPGPRQDQIPSECYYRYSDRSSNTSSYGPLTAEGRHMFQSNRYGDISVKSPPVQGMVERYGDWRNAFPVLVPNTLDSSSPLVQLLVAKINAVRTEDYAQADLLSRKISHVNGDQGSDCYASPNQTSCAAVAGCQYTTDLGCVPGSVVCKHITNATYCSDSLAGCSWTDESGCYSNCATFSTLQTECDTAGCYYDQSTHTCLDPRPEAIRIVEGLKTLGWIDEYTRALTVDQLLYNANSKHFIYITYFIEILPIGVWIPQVKSLSFHVMALWGTKQKALFALDVLITLYVAWSLLHVCLMFRHNLEVGKVGDKHDEMEDEVTVSHSNNLYETKRSNGSSGNSRDGKKSWGDKIVSAVDFTLVFELFFTAMFATAYTFKWMMWAQGIEMSNWNPTDVTDLQAWNDVVEYLITANTERVLTASAIILAWLRLFEYVQYNARLNSLTETIKIAMRSLISLGIIFMVVFIGFMYAGNLVYGIEHEDFNTLIRTGGFLGRLLFSAQIDDYAKFRQIEPNWSIVYFGLFMVLGWLVLLNMVLAIITSSFNVVKENCKDENGEDTSPSWEVTSVMTDIKKFFKKVTTREQPFAFSAHSVTERQDQNQNALDGLKGNYVIDRIRAIQILDGLNNDNYFTLQELVEALQHLHPSDVKRIFSKSCCETSFGNRTTRRTDRQASLLNARIGDVDRTIKQLILQVADQEGLLKTSHGHLLSVENELGRGVVSNISEAVHNIDNNVYNLPPHLTEILNKKLSLLQRNVGEPIDGLKGNFDELVALLSSPVHIRKQKPLSSPLPPPNPIESAFPQSPRAKNPVRSTPNQPVTSPVTRPYSKLTTVEGVVDV